MFPVSEELIEKMAAASWDRCATVKWADFFTGPHEQLKHAYIDQMRQAVMVLLREEGRL